MALTLPLWSSVANPQSYLRGSLLGYSPSKILNKNKLFFFFQYKFSNKLIKSKEGSWKSDLQIVGQSTGNNLHLRLASCVKVDCWKLQFVAHGKKHWSQPGFCWPEINKLPDVSLAKRGFLFRISGNCNLGSATMVCNHCKQPASHHRAREGKHFHREEKKLRATVNKESMDFCWPTPCQERSGTFLHPLGLSHPHSQAETLLCQQRSIWSRLWFFQWSCMDVRVGLWRKLSTKKLILLNCGVGEDSWESLGLQGDPTSPS